MAERCRKLCVLPGVCTNLPIGRFVPGSHRRWVGMDRRTIWDHTVAQRQALAGILRTLTPEQWEHPSLCDGWRVEDVAAHVISSPQVSWRLTLGMLPEMRHGYDEMILRDGLRRGQAGREAILDQFA